MCFCSTDEGLVAPMKRAFSGLSSRRLNMLWDTVEELVVVGGPMSACPTSASTILVKTPERKHLLAKYVQRVDFPASASPSTTATPRVCMRVAAASPQLGEMVDPMTCRTAPDSPILVSTMALASVSMGILRPLATVRDSPICSGASRIVADPSLSRTLDGPSTRRVLSGFSLS